MPRSPQVHFRLKPLPLEDQGKKDATTLIYLQFVYNRRRLFFSFGQKTKISNWNQALQRVKNKKETTADGQHSINDLLDNLKAVCEKSYKEALKAGIPTPEQLRQKLQDFLDQNKEEPKDGPTLFKLIDRFVAGEIKTKGQEKSQSTLDNYEAVKKHLEAFQKVTRYKVDFDTITLDFFYTYISFLKKLKWSGGTGLGQNTIAKDIRLLKVFMGEAVDLGYTKNFEFKNKKFTVKEEETDAVYLTEKEIIALYNFDLSNHRSFKKLDAVRDLFVVGCFTGLRYSDYSNIKPENIVQQDAELYIKMITQKTKDLVIIPANPVVLQIFKKYENNANRLPRSLSNQKFNDYVKDVCKAAEFNEVGRLSTDPTKPLWECVSSHTARRSMATNLYLEGFPTIDLMKITGHKTEKAFLKYIRVSKLDTAKRLNEHIKKNWSSKILKAAC
jgi:integrase